MRAVFGGNGVANEVRQLSILIVSPSPEGSLAWFCSRALQRLGHQVTLFDPRVLALGPNYATAGPPTRVRILRNRVGIWLMNRQLVRRARQAPPDLVLVIKGELILANTVKELARSGTPAALWYPDTSEGLRQRARRRIVEAMTQYDVTFICDPKHLAEPVRQRARRLEYLTFACDPLYHRPVPLGDQERAKWASPIAFVGNWQPPPSQRAEVIASLRDLPIGVWGYGWQQSSLASSAPARFRGPAYGADLVRVYSASQIALNIAYQDYLNLRNFEAPACGPLFVTNVADRLEEHFQPDVEVVTYAHVGEIRDKLSFYLGQPEAARVIAARGRERAHREHTFDRRMSELIARVLG
jgi:spore maturation protein CgeB